MIAETGLFSLILALFVALSGGVLPLIGVRHHASAWMAISRSSAWVQFLLVSLAGAALMQAFAASDFSLLAVAANSHTDKPLLYKVAASWAGSEGSLLLWVWILSVYAAAFAAAPLRLSAPARTLSLSVLALISAAFLAYLLLTGHPFVRLAPAPLNGVGLNPLLLDPGLTYHPPLLYLGYAGYAPVFALAMAMLIRGQCETAAMAALHFFSLLAWTFLTLGIGLGAWWSYRTLGWGGWWAWDPVENAALMPWLAGTALLHTVRAARSRGVLKAWTVFLALSAFCLSLLGFLLARSGVMASVHAFARGPSFFALGIFVLAGGTAFAVFAWRGGRLRDAIPIAFVSRESGILFASVVWTVAIATVLIGTFYPLLLDTLNMGRISVGPPYYDTMFAALAVPLAALMAMPMRLHRLLWLIAAAMVAVAAVILAGGGATWSPVLVALAVFVAGVTGGSLHWRTLGKTIAHLGVALLLAALAAFPWQYEAVAVLHPGDTAALAGHVLRLEKVETLSGLDYNGMRAHLVLDNGARLTPEVRAYGHPAMAKAVPAIRPGLLGDLYAVLGDANAGGYTFHVMFRPMQGAVFVAMILMALGGVLALFSGGEMAAAVAPSIPPRAGGRILRFVPMLALAALAVFLAYRFAAVPTGDAPPDAAGPPPVAAIDRPLPAFDLPPLFEGGANLKSADFRGKATVVNFFASWCAPCRAETPALKTLARSGVAVYGIAYKDKTDAARNFLAAAGNPYTNVGLDAGGRVAIDFGLTGVPETYVIDGRGRIRLRHAGPLTDDIVRTEIVPLLRGLP